MAIATRDLFLDLDRSSPVPLYFQLAERLRAAIEGGVLEPGARIENEVALAAQIGMSRPTVRRAIQELVDQGLLVRRRGVGTQVVRGRFAREVQLSSLHDDLVRGNREPSTRVLEYRVVAADAELAAQLGVEPGTELLSLERLRSADGVPIGHLRNHLAPEYSDIPREALERFGLYQLLRGRGASMRVAKQSIGARAASAREAELLETEVGAPLLTMSRSLYDDTGRAVEYGSHCYRPDLYSFEVTLVEK
ncbi:GntR family transcriptional regulator [Microterricola viridarii]|uniref:Transcriptional regulator, GntR family n=1 Tax=Microterricola viridarii TaxID=412690 RepID=A0A1H1XTM4_9MICO|nr:GntR family transcriptional regulator [Microterricola viridarii]SDT12543.1 transcriptional regulator, GntR family [Microterricola viridarii]